MRRLGGILMNVTTAISTLLCLTTIVAWIISYSVAKPPWFSRSTGPNAWEDLLVWPGEIMLERGTHLIPIASQVPGGIMNESPWQHRFPGVIVEGRRSVPYTAARSPVYTQSVAVFVSFWMLTLVTAIAPAVWVYRRRLSLRALMSRLQLGRSAARLRAGRCPICGYDLRATPDRCPECGALQERVKR